MDIMEEPLLTVNYHTHTKRCGHAEGEEREYIENAIKGGIKKLGFSDHAPFVFPDGHESNYRIPERLKRDYTDTVSALKKEYEGEIDIFIGYEMEYYPEFFEDMLKNLAEGPLDYLILGQHFLENELTHVYSGAVGDSESRLIQYVDQVTEGLATGVFTYLAHPDLPDFTGDEAVYRREMRRLCLNAKAMHIPLEINFLGLMQGRNYPCERFFRIAAELDCDVIYGCDAHSPSPLSDMELRARARSFAERCGVRIIRDTPLRDPKLYFDKKQS